MSHGEDRPPADGGSGHEKGASEHEKTGRDGTQPDAAGGEPGTLGGEDAASGAERQPAAGAVPPVWQLQRVLVALDASPASAAAAHTAARLAALLETELAGLFVEDAELARLAELPALEVGSYSAAPRSLGLGDVERRLRVQAQRARRMFEATAARVSVRTTFRVVRGSVSQEVLLAAGAGELLSLGRTGSSSLSRLGSLARAALARGRGSLLLLPPRGRLGPPVVVVFTDTPEGHRALAAAARLPGRASGAGMRGAKPRSVAASGDELIVLLPAVDDAEAVRLGRAASVALAAHGRRARLRRAAPGDPHALVHAVAAERAHVLVLPGDSPLAAGDEIEGVVERLSCAVLLVR